jgi:hypothetical protein
MCGLVCWVSVSTVNCVASVTLIQSMTGPQAPVLPMELSKSQSSPDSKPSIQPPQDLEHSIQPLESSIQPSEPSVQPSSKPAQEPPEGGLDGWLTVTGGYAQGPTVALLDTFSIVFARFLIVFCSGGLVQSYGVFQDYYSVNARSPSHWAREN